MPIIEQASDKLHQNVCRFCGRTYASRQSMLRHMRSYCKISSSEEGMAQLIDHTLQRQVLDLKAHSLAQDAKIARLTEIVEGYAPLTIATSNQVFIGPVTTTNAVINVNAWDGDRRIGVEVRDIVAMLADNATVREYTRLGDHEAANPAVAPPYVMELLMDLTRRAHADPAARNVYLNPRRADQVLVHMTSGRWEVLSLAEATRLIFDGIAKGIMAVSRRYEERRALPIEAQSALAIAGLLYDDEPDEYVKRARGPMAAHLANTAPGADIAVPRLAAA
jgi:hypothetical protein